MIKNKPPRKKKCKGCKEWFQPTRSFQVACSPICAIKVTQESVEKKTRKEASERTRKDIEERRELRRRKNELNRSGQLDKLQDLVNQWVVNVRDKDEGCITCGKKSDVKYDAGHYRTRGACPELRYELTNIHKQCSVNCNQHASGARLEYRDAILNKYGKDHLDWLDGPHPKLKDILPDNDAIEEQIKRWRVMLRYAGLKPRR